MILRPSIEDYKIVGYYLGKIIAALGILMIIPLLLAAAYSELEPIVNFLLSISLTMLVGIILVLVCYTKKDLATMHAMSVTALTFLAAMLVSALPLYMSGHFNSYLDACFEAMSGYTTTGLSLVNDLDHMAYSYNFWRHFTIFIGGQGIVVIALTFLFKGTAGAFRMYVGEAREEKIVPNVIGTARFIWLTSLVYLILGTAALSASAIFGGLRFPKAIFDSVCIFMAGWDTGGFSPQSQNIIFYHNPFFELISASLIFLGAMNFALHHAAWTGNRRELYKNIETNTFFISMIIIASLTAWAVGFTGTYKDAIPFCRKVFYQFISAHTTTGFSTIYARQFVNEWGQMGMLGITLAMAIGGGACSTAGAIKLLRIGIIYKALRQDIKKLLIPETAVLVQKIHHIKDMVLENKHVRSASLIMVFYLILYIFGTVAGMFFGYSLSEASFESVSAAANVGLSCGITLPSMPDTLKIVYIIQMWAGRLEFIAIFALVGMVLASLKGKR